MLGKVFDNTLHVRQLSLDEWQQDSELDGLSKNTLKAHLMWRVVPFSNRPLGIIPRQYIGIQRKDIGIGTALGFVLRI